MRASLRFGVVLGGSLVLLLLWSASAAAAPPDNVGLFDPDQGQWHINGTSFYFGNPNDVPVVGDWDCDGDATAGVFRPSGGDAGTVLLRNSNDAGSADIDFVFGNPDDIPLAGDFNDDGCDTVSLYRPSTGEVFIKNSVGAGGAGIGAADFSYIFGNPADAPFAGDFDGDGTDTVGLHRESTGQVFLRNSNTTGVADVTFTYGDPGDRFFAGDWTADGTDTAGLFRPSDTRFFLRDTNTAGVADEAFFGGESSWLPVAAEFGLPRKLLAALSDEETPGPGDADGTGLAVVTLSRGPATTGEVCFDITTANVETITAAHIHTGALGTAGPVFIGFDVATNGLSGCVTADNDKIDAILISPEDYYVNLHNAPFPPGAIRGQLGRDAELMAVMSDEETPGPGDTDGSGLAVVTFSHIGNPTGSVCFDIGHSNIDPISAAHIHTGALGTAGPVLVGFDVPTNGLNGCVNADVGAINDILTDPAGFYVNLHNAPFPPGAIRGQLGRRAQLMAGLSDEEVPGPGDTDGTGLAVVTFSREGEVCFGITASKVDPITAAHIHTGALGTSGPVLIDFDVPTNGLEGCVESPQASIDDVLTDPAGFYVNLHNATFPPGAIRGQLQKTITLTATLSGSEAVPGPGDSDGTGSATVSFSRTGEVCVSLTHMNIDPITAAHIHEGALGAAGGIVIPFDVATDGLSGCVEASQDAIDGVLADPAGFYVNLHNAPFPPGAIRGQLERTAKLMATLSDEEVPGPGDANGTGLAVVTFSRTGEVCFDIRHINIDPITAAHIHTGALGTAGPVLVDFDVPSNGLSGCVMATPATVFDILRDPAGFYVNLHNTAFPPGAIRGQLGPEATLTATLSGSEAVPGPGDSDGTGSASVTFSRLGEACFGITASNVALITAAHIHAGPLGTAGGIVLDFDVPTNGLSGCVNDSQATIDDILFDPAGFYVNLHNAPFPPGAIRGQLGN